MTSNIPSMQSSFVPAAAEQPNPKNPKAKSTHLRPLSHSDERTSKRRALNAHPGQKEFEGVFHVSEIKTPSSENVNFMVHQSFFNDLMAGKTNISIEERPPYKEEIKKLLIKILAVEPGRELLYRISKFKNKKIFIKKVTPTYSETSTVFDDHFKNITVYLDLKPFQATTRSKCGIDSPIPSPNDVILFHELVHALNMCEAKNRNEYIGYVQRAPLNGKEFDNYEEERTIGFRGHNDEDLDPSAWKKRSRLCENDYRLVHKDSPGIRYGHRGICQKPKNLNPTDPETISYFLQVCSEGYISEVEDLLKLGIDPNACVHSDSKFFPLFHAAQNGHFKLVLKLIEWGADHTKVTNGQKGLVHFCIKSGDVSMLNYLVVHGYIQIQISDWGNVPLIPYAVKHLKSNCRPMIEYLLKKGASFHRLRGKLTTPLHEASTLKDSGLFNYLSSINKGAISPYVPITITQRNKDGLTPVHYAIRAGNVNFVREFIKAVPYDPTWLFFAAMSNDMETFQLIYNLNPNVHKNDILDNKSIIDFAFLGKKGVRDKREFLNFLQGLGFAIEKRNLGLYATYYLTAPKEIKEKVILEVYKHLSFEDPEILGSTILEWAVIEGDHAFVEFLLINGAKCNFPLIKHQNKTVLHLAVERNDAPMVKILLNYGADKHQKDSLGVTPVETTIQKFMKDDNFDPDIFFLLMHDTFSEVPPLESVDPLELSVDRINAMISPKIARLVEVGMSASSSSSTESLSLRENDTG